MKRIVILLTAVIMAVFLLAGCKSSSTLTPAQKLEDFEYMWGIMEQNYPFLEVNKRLTGVDWLAHKEEYRSRIAAAKTDTDFFLAMDSVLGELHNGHTALTRKERYDHLLDTLYTNSSADDPWSRLLYQPEVLKRYGRSAVAEPSVTGQADSDNAGTVRAKSAVKPTGSSGTSNNVQGKILAPGKTAYLAIHSFEREHLAEDVPVINKFLQEVEAYETLILDIRGNPGGDSSFWQNYLVPLLITEPLSYDIYTLYRGGEYADLFLKARHLDQGLRPIAELAEEHLPNLPPESLVMFSSFQKTSMQIVPLGKLNFKGGIYLLVDGAVFSTSEGLAVFAKSSGFATVVGERTGGDGLGIEPILAVLPNSKVVFSFSLEMGLVADGSCNEEVKTTPDIEADPDMSNQLLEQPAIMRILETEQH